MIVSLRNHLIIASFCVPVLSGDCLGQHRNANWIIGQNWISFQDGEPNGMLVPEGVVAYGKSSLSDTAGQLRVFQSVSLQPGLFNGSFEIITGCPSCEMFGTGGQDGIFIPVPGDMESAFFFRCAATTSGSEVFKQGLIRLDLGGEGGTASFLQSDFDWILEPACFKRMIVPHADGLNYWFVTQGQGSDAILAFRIDESGASTSPVTTHTGHELDQEQFAGLLVPTLDGTRFVNVSQRSVVVPQENDTSLAALLQFDPSTGIAVPWLTLEGLVHVKGAEFSASGRFLYLADGYWSGDQMVRRLFQYDLDQTDVNGTRVLLDSTLGPLGLNNGFSVLERAPNGRVYVAHEWSSYMGVVNQPDLPAPSCAYVREAFQPSIPVHVLPSFAKRYHDDPPDYTMSLTQGQIRADAWRIVPNPIREEGTLYGSIDGPIMLQWCDVLGRVALETPSVACGGSLALDTHGLSEGPYVLRAIPDSGPINAVRVVVQR